MVKVEAAPFHRANILAAVFGLGLAFYLAIEPTPLWLLLLLAALVGVGVDAIVRNHPASVAAGPTGTVVYLPLATLATVAAGIALERVTGGYWWVLATAAVTPALGLLLHASYLSLEVAGAGYQAAR